MSRSAQNQLEMIVDRVVRPVLAGRARKRLMREELLAHVTAVYEQELASLGDERAAVERTRQRFGVAKDVSFQLQASVPLLESRFLTFERVILMSRWFWLTAVFAVAFGPAILLPAAAALRDQQVLHLVPMILGSLITLAGLGAVCYGVAARLIRTAK